MLKVSPFMSQAEQLIHLAREFRFPSNQLWVVDTKEEPGTGATDRDLALLQTALHFERADAGLIFKAIMEGWSLERINRELY